MPISTSYPQNPPSHENVCQQPVLTIIEQPARETRYRYKSESGSHGPLIGESSTPQRKTYPTVKLECYDPKVPYRVKASLYTFEDNPQPHVHKITMKGRDEEDCCYVTVREDGRATFPSMSIVFQQKKTVADMLFRRKVKAYEGTDLTEAQRKQLQNEAKKEASEMNLNLVRICFTAERCDKGIWQPVCHVFSNPVANSKAGKLKITKVNRSSGSCVGNDEVWILCEKINKKDIQIRFYEWDEESQRVCWEALATFSESDVHYQVAIVFRTPSYRDTTIQRDVKVQFQLRRISDGETSDSIDFVYRPRSPTEQETLMHKRRKLSSQSSHQSSMEPGMPSSSSSSLPGSSYGDPQEPPPTGLQESPGEHDLWAHKLEELFKEYETLFPSKVGAGAKVEQKCSSPVQGEPWVPELDELFRDETLFSDIKETDVRAEWETPSLIQGGMETDSEKIEASMRRLSVNDRGVENPKTLHRSLICHLLQWLFVGLTKMLTTVELLRVLALLTQYTTKNAENLLHLLIGHNHCAPKPLRALLCTLHHGHQLQRCIAGRDIRGQTPLHVAVLQGNVIATSLLLEFGSNEVSRDNAGNTALHAACENATRTKCLKVLIAHVTRNCIDLNLFNSSGMAPIHLAVVNRNIPGIGELCKVGVDINIPEDLKGDTPLHLAVRQNSTEVASVLLKQRGIDRDLLNHEGYTALDLALESSREDLAAIFLQEQDAVTPSNVSEPSKTCQNATFKVKTEPVYGEGGVSGELGTPCSPALRKEVVKTLGSVESARKMLELLTDKQEADSVLRLVAGPRLGAVLFDNYLKDRSEEEIRNLLDLSNLIV